MIKRMLCIFFALVLFQVLLNAQEDTTHNSDISFSLPQTGFEQAKAKTNFHSGAKAALLSTCVPGLGQIYNKQLWKSFVVYAGIGAAIYFAVVNCKNMNKFKDEYYDRIDGKGKQLSGYLNYSDESIYKLYESYKDNFHLSVIMGVLAYGIQILDAYVYGHLFDFDMSDDLTLNLRPSLVQSLGTSLTGVPGLSFSLRF